MEENLEQQDAQQEIPEGNPTPSEGSEETLINEETLTPEQISDLKKRASVSSQNFERAKKLEKDIVELRKLKGLDKESEEHYLKDPKEIVALSKIPVEDMDEVIRWCNTNGKKPSEVNSDKYLSIFLRERAEERLTAAATATKGGRKMTKDTPEEIVSRASKGDLPEDDEGIAKLAEAHQLLKLKKLQH